MSRKIKKKRDGGRGEGGMQVDTCARKIKWKRIEEHERKRAHATVTTLRHTKYGDGDKLGHK